MPTRKIITIMLFHLAITMDPIYSQYFVGGFVMDDPYPLRRASVPIEGVNVCLRGPGQFIWLDMDCAAETTTSSTGEYVIESSGEYYCVDFSAPGFVLQEHCFRGRDTTLNVRLLRSGSHASILGTIRGTGCFDGACLVDSGCAVQAVIADPCIEDGCGDGSGWLKLSEAAVDVDGCYELDSVPLSRNGLEVTVQLRCGSRVFADSVTELWNRDIDTLNIVLNNQPASVGPSSRIGIRTAPSKVNRVWDIRGRSISATHSRTENCVILENTARGARLILLR